MQENRARSRGARVNGRPIYPEPFEFPYFTVIALILVGLYFWGRA